MKEASCYSHKQKKIKQKKKRKTKKKQVYRSQGKKPKFIIKFNNRQ